MFAQLSRIGSLGCLALALAASACEEAEEEPAPVDDGIEVPRGSYEIDEETGETRASYTNDDGTITTMRSGKRVPVELPAGFDIYPSATVVNNTRVEQADGTMVLLDLESADDPAQLIAYYREQAEKAGVDLDVELETGAMTMIGGQAENGASFSFTATSQDAMTHGQLSIGRGLR